MMRDLFQAWCRSVGLEIVESKTIPYGEQFLVGDGFSQVPVNIYSSGKALVQGQPSELREKISGWISHNAVQSQKKSVRERTGLKDLGDRIGIDESGKGDYFGPLVICAAFAHHNDDEWLSELGVQDSKQIEDKRLIQIAREIREAVEHEVIVISPKRYNELYPDFRNLNRMLAWGHARALESLLERVNAPVAISDKFSARDHLQAALMEKGSQVKLIQITGAEQDLSVAAASIFARAAFLRSLKKLEEEYEMPFGKGASTIVEQQARDFVERYGAERLGEVAKLHFKTTLKVTSLF